MSNPSSKKVHAAPAVLRGRGPLRVLVEPAVDDVEPFTAESTAFPGAHAHGRTQKEAVENAQDLVLSLIGERGLKLLARWVKEAGSSSLRDERLLQETVALIKGTPPSKAEA